MHRFCLSYFNGEVDAQHIDSTVEPEEAMMDLKVGELWLWVNSTEPDPSDEHKLSAEEGRYLIHKLVEERNCRRIGCQNFDEHVHPFGERPISDFGIPEEGWE